jgi:hypothetical protein
MKKIALTGFVFSFFLFISSGETLQKISPHNLSKDNIPSDTSKNWQQIKTVEDVCNAFPQRMDSLMKEINLNSESLKNVKAAYEGGNIVLACTQLLNYYKNANTVKYLRKDCVPSSNERDASADSILQHILTFYLETDKVPTNADGHLNWKYHGPNDDIEWAWALNRHYYFDNLLTAWFKTGNPDYANKIDVDLRDWIISSLPYPGVKSNTELWRGLEVSFRVKVWARIFYGLINCPELTPATRLLMLSSIPEHAHYLKNFHSEGNWLTMEMSGLATAATVWPEFNKSPSWLAYSKETMTASLKKQVYPDGVQTELTSHYHQVALNNFSLFMELCKQAKEPLLPLYASQVEKMWNYIAYTMRPDGYGLLNNDADLDYNRDKITAAALDYGRKDWLYIASNGKKGVKPKGPPSIIFPWAGQLIMRSGFEPNAQWAFFDIGPWGTGHQHNDKLHLSVSAYGRDLLVDGGRFAYRGEVAKKFRHYATGSFSHNVLLIDSNGQAPGPGLNTQPISQEHFRITKDFDYSWSSFDKFINVKGESKHTRAIFYVRGKFWVVVDRINTDRPHKIEALWHWHPDCKVLIKKNNIVSTQNENGNLEIIPVGSTPWSVSLVKGQENPDIQGWYSKEYNEYVPNTASIYSTEINKSSSFVWILYPSKNNSPMVQAKIISENKDGITLQVVNSNEGKWTLKIPFSNSNNVSYQFIKSKQ